MGSPSTLRDEFTEKGLCIFQDESLQRRAAMLRSRFAQDFASKFNQEPVRNRNLLKRFGDSLDVARFFADPIIERTVKLLGIEDPVFCGPAVTHYTSHDLTGQSFGLPFHQDWPSMASSLRSAILWVSLTVSNEHSHSVEVVPEGHRRGLLEGTQSHDGYVLQQQAFSNSLRLSVLPGDLVIMSPFLPHRTYLHPRDTAPKLSLSRRVDDLNCVDWAERQYATAYGVTVDRQLYAKKRPA